jgi:peptidoglycan-associated lipoprotein
MTTTRRAIGLTVTGLLLFAAACHHSTPPVARPTPPPIETPPPAADNRPPAPPPPVDRPVTVPDEPRLNEDSIAAASLEDLNRSSPLKPAFFELDSSDIDPAAKAALDEDAAILKRYPTWAVTIEGHCDERGSAEYNLSLGERRAIAAKSYLVSVGISADRIKTVSYGKEFPFDPGHDETAYAKNRRAHFVVTAK